jgi:septum formation inhibitor-activating ATPase MinD
VDGGPVHGRSSGSSGPAGRLDLLVRHRDAGSSRDLAPLIGEQSHGHDLVVVDLPRGDRLECETALLVADTALLVVPTEVRAIVGAHAMRTWVEDCCSDLRLVTRTVRRGGVDPEVVTTSLGLPVAGILPTERSVEEDLDRGEPPAGRRGSLRRWAEDFLLELDQPVQRIAS